jgi:NAD(P)-dependent dehydrogenase (short-subunit alcohol dehydrogenase family)
MARPLSSRHRTALVTGAGSGLGAAFATMLSGEGIRVWGTARRPGDVSSPAGVVFVPMELADSESVAAAWARAEAESGGIDLLVNNAGSADFAPFELQSIDSWDTQLAVALHGPARLARLAVAAMRGRGRGCIVNVSSLATEFPIPFMSAYNAGKAALSALTASLELEGADEVVTFVDFRPGDHQTRFNKRMTPSPELVAALPACARAWTRLEDLMARAPHPEKAARDLRRALARGRSGMVRSGGFFQSACAPFLARFGSTRLVRSIIRRYFRAAG